MLPPLESAPQLDSAVKSLYTPATAFSLLIHKSPQADDDVAAAPHSPYSQCAERCQARIVRRSYRIEAVVSLPDSCFSSLGLLHTPQPHSLPLHCRHDYTISPDVKLDLRPRTSYTFG